MTGELHFRYIETCSLLTWVFQPADPVTETGEPLPPGAPPPPRPELPEDTAFAEFRDQIGFELADLLFRRVEMSATNVDLLMELWAADMLRHNDFGPFRDSTHLYEAIDATRVCELYIDVSSYLCLHILLRSEMHLGSV